MEWQHLEYFRVAARLQHMTRAAQTLGVTQPALTRAMYRLERHLGVPLFRHVGRTTELTEYGRAFVPRVERALAELDAGQRELAALAAREQGLVLLGSLRTLGATCVPRLVRGFLATHPAVRFSFLQGRPAELLAKLAGGEINLALTDAPADATLVAWEPIFDQELVVIVPPDHRLASRESIRLCELAGEAIVTYERGNGIRTAVEQLSRAADFEPNIMFEAQYSSNVRGLVAAGVGVALVPEMGAEWQLPTLRISAPSPARRRIGVAAIRDRSLSDAERVFREFVIATSHLTGTLTPVDR